MKYKHIIFFAVTILLLVVAIFLFLFKFRQEMSDVVVDSLASATPPLDRASQATLPSSVASQPVVQKGQEVKNEPDTKQQKAYMKAFLTPIAFWGKVIDESGQPIADAVVKLGANDNPNPMGEGSTYEVITDIGGVFAIKNIRGISLSIQVSKGGYYSTDQSRGKVNYVLANNTDTPIPTRENPSIFVLQKMGEPAALRRVEKSLNLPKNGGIVMIDLEGGNVAGQGDLKIECWVQDQGVEMSIYNPYDWRCVISVPDGGLVERTNSLDFIAPIDGYQSFNEIHMSKTLKNWRQQVSNEYFIKRANGTFARVKIRVVTGVNNFVRFESYVNPKKGDRNLQYDPAKQLQ